jgi:hypothetical protein
MNNNHFDFISFAGNCKVSLVSSLTLTLTSLWQVDTNWIVIDSWSEVGVIVGMMISIANFSMMMYEKFWRKKKKER